MERLWLTKKDEGWKGEAYVLVTWNTCSFYKITFVHTFRTYQYSTAQFTVILYNHYTVYWNTLEATNALIKSSQYTIFTTTGTSKGFHYVWILWTKKKTLLGVLTCKCIIISSLMCSQILILKTLDIHARLISCGYERFSWCIYSVFHQNIQFYEATSTAIIHVVMLIIIFQHPKKRLFSFPTRRCTTLFQ